jgi:hypothetical protein
LKARYLSPFADQNPYLSIFPLIPFSMTTFPIFRAALLLLLVLETAYGQVKPPIFIGDQRELFVDRTLIESLESAQLKMHRPIDEGLVF